MNIDAGQTEFGIKQYDLNLSQILSIVIKRKQIVLITFLIFLIIASAYILLTPSIYQLKAYIKINNIEKNYRRYTSLNQLNANTLLLLIGQLDKEKRELIFSKHDEIKDASTDVVKGSADTILIKIESAKRDLLTPSFQELLEWSRNILEVKKIYQKNLDELDFSIRTLDEMDRKNDFQIREIEKRLVNSKILPVAFNPSDVNNQSIQIKEDKFYLEALRKNYAILSSLADTYVSKKPVKPKKFRIFIFSCVSAIFISLLSAFIAEYFAIINKSRNN